MKTIILILSAAVIVVLALSQVAGASPNISKPKSKQKPQSFKKTITKTIAVNYLLFLPEDYGKQDKERGGKHDEERGGKQDKERGGKHDEERGGKHDKERGGKQDKKWPLIMFLHGAGERGDNLDLLKKHGPPKIVEADSDFPFIVVSPQCPKNSWWPAEEELLINLLDSIIEKYDVDPDRVYLTGLSMGGYGTWHLGCTYPDRFAAVVPICGGGQRLLACNLKDVPVWAFHGGKDNVVPLEDSQEMVDRLKKCGGDVKLTIYPEATHDAWTETYDNPQLYKWLLSYRKEKK